MFGRKILDAVGGKSRNLSEKLIEKYRDGVGEQLLGREERIKFREVELDKREHALAQRERQLERYIHIPKLYLQIPLVLGLCIAAYFGYSELALRTSPGERADSASCQERGVAYYKEISSYPTLSNGENADSKITGMCARSSMAFSH